MTFFNKQDLLINSICQNSISLDHSFISFLSDCLIDFDKLSITCHYHSNLLTNLLLFYQYLISNNNIISEDVLKIKDNHFSLFKKYLIKNDFSPFLNKHSADLFHNLWFPLISNSSQLDRSSLNGYYTSSNATFYIYQDPNMSSQNVKFLDNFYRSFHPVYEKPADTDSILVARKIRLFPSPNYIELFWRTHSDVVTMMRPFLL